MRQCCFTVKLQKCFVSEETSANKDFHLTFPECVWEVKQWHCTGLTQKTPGSGSCSHWGSGGGVEERKFTVRTFRSCEVLSECWNCWFYDNSSMSCVTSCLRQHVEASVVVCDGCWGRFNPTTRLVSGTVGTFCLCSTRSWFFQTQTTCAESLKEQLHVLNHNKHFLFSKHIIRLQRAAGQQGGGIHGCSSRNSSNLEHVTHMFYCNTCRNTQQMSGIKTTYRN